MGSEPVKAPEKSLKEQVREHKREIQKTSRVIEREKKKYELEEKKLKSELKKLVHAGQHNSAKMLAIDISRVRSQQAKITEFLAHLKGLELRIGLVWSFNEISSEMETTAKAMKSVSHNIDSNKLSEMIKKMNKEDLKIEKKSEILFDILDKIGEQYDNPEETEKIYSEVLQEEGLNLKNELPDLNSLKDYNKKAEEDDIDRIFKELKQ